MLLAPAQSEYSDTFEAFLSHHDVGESNVAEQWLISMYFINTVFTTVSSPPSLPPSLPHFPTPSLGFCSHSFAAVWFALGVAHLAVHACVSMLP